MIPDFDPRGYPGPRPPGPVLVHRGELHPLSVDGSPGTLLHPTDAAAGDRLRSWSVPALADPEGLRWSVAYGSNASPGRLVAKGLDQDGAVLLPARVCGVAPAFEHRRTGYGSVPLTLVPAPGEVHDTWVLGLPPGAATDLLDRTEGRVPDGAPPTVGPATGDGRFAPLGTYQLAEVGEVAVADRFVLPTALAYLPGPATRVQIAADGGWRTWPSWDQADAGAHVERSGLDGSAPTLARAVLGPWPETPLRDLPLFLAGILQPEGPAWQRIAELARVLGPATVPGTQGGGTRGVRGTLVAPTGPSQARTLYRVLDGDEVLPTAFVRSSVQVEGPDGRSWAAIYARSIDQPPSVEGSSRKWVVR